MTDHLKVIDEKPFDFSLSEVAIFSFQTLLFIDSTDLGYTFSPLAIASLLIRRR